MKNHQLTKLATWILWAGASALLPLSMGDKSLAATLTYDLVEVNFRPGGSATGFFAIDSLTGRVLDSEITTTSLPGTAFSGSTYTDSTGQIIDTLFYLSSNSTDTPPVFYNLFLTIEASALGTARLNTSNFTIFEGARFGSPSGFTMGERLVIFDSPGELVLRTEVAAVPEPLAVVGTLAAMGIGAFFKKLHHSGKANI